MRCLPHALIPRRAGFTLVELMIVVAILGFFLSIALPSYQAFIQQARRDDARHLLMLNAHRLQRCFTLEGVYNGRCVLRDHSENGHYVLNASRTANTFLLVATPVAGSSQASDTDCPGLTYDHMGQRGVTGVSSEICW